MRNRDRQTALDTLTKDIAVLNQHYTTAIKNCRDWSGRGHPTHSPGSGQQIHGTGTTNTVLAIIETGRQDTFAADLKAADRALQQAVTNTAWLTRFVRRNLAVPPEKEPTDCTICGRYVARTTKDPLRRGRCNACDLFLRRHGRDRTIEDFIADATA